LRRYLFIYGERAKGWYIIMDIRRSINTKVWSDDWFETLKPVEKLIWFYLLTNPQTNMLGIYEVSVKRISFETGLKDAEISNALKAFERVKKAFYWFGWIVLPNWMKNQSLNTNMVTSASRLFDTLPNELKVKLLDNGFESFESLLKGCQSLPKKEKEIESEIEVEIESKEEKEKQFRKQVFSFRDKYSDKMLSAFFNYWSEKSKSGRMRWEMEKTYEIEKRLVTWHSREKEDIKPVVLGINPFDMIPQ